MLRFIHSSNTWNDYGAHIFPQVNILDPCNMINILIIYDLLNGISIYQKVPNINNVLQRRSLIQIDVGIHLNNTTYHVLWLSDIQQTVMHTSFMPCYIHDK